MRSVLACLTAGVLAAALASAVPASAQTSAPAFDPSPVVLTDADSPTVSGTVQLEEADGLTFQSARVYDPSCPLTWDSLPVDPCRVWLNDVGTSKVGNVRSVDLSGTIPLEDGTGSRVDRPTTYVTVVYTDGTHEYLDTGLDIYGGYQVTLEGPDTVGAGATLSMTAKAEHFTGEWVPDSGFRAELQHLSTDGAWEQKDTRTTDPAGRVSFAPQPFSETGDWRVALTDPASTVAPPPVTYSAVKGVALGAPAPPAPTPTPAPAPAPTPAPTPGPAPAAAPAPPVATPAAKPVIRPSAPRRQHAIAGSGRATLSWAPPASTGGARIDRYQIRRGTFTRNLPPTARHFTFTHLRNGSLYRLYVRAHNTRGFSGWVAAPARPHAPPRPRDYAGCPALNRVYPHGVGRPGARDRGGNVTTFATSLATYRLNTEDDRDRDGIACEKR